MSENPLFVMAALLGLVVATSVAGGGVGLSAATPVDVAITSVDVTPASPVPGEAVELTATVQNFGTSEGSYVINAVAIRSGQGDDFDELDRYQRPGRVSPGSSFRISLVETFDSPGIKRLRVVVYGETEDGESIKLKFPVTVGVTDVKPQVEVDFRHSVAGVESNATVVVANGMERGMRNVEVWLESGAAVEGPRRISSVLAAGETREFSFEVVPARAGELDLTAIVEYRLAEGPTQRVSTTTTVEARRLDARVSLRTNVSGGRVAVTATNLGNADVRDLVVAGESTNATVGEASIRVLKPGTSRTVVIPISRVRAAGGTTRVNVTGTYKVGENRRTTHAGPVYLRHGLTLNASTTGDGIAVAVAHVGDLRVDRIVVRGRAPNATVGQSIVRTLEPGETATVRLDVSDIDELAKARIRARYRVGGVTGTAVDGPVVLRSNSGRIELTGIDVRSRNGHLEISGSASNIGLSTVNSVVIEVQDADGVTPVAPNREYFVGSVPASDFVSFDVTARVEGNVSKVPLKVTYLSGGVRRVERDSVPVRSRTIGTPERQTGTGEPGFSAMVGMAVVGAVGSILFIGWRNSDAGS